MKKPNKAYLLLGSNIEPRIDYLKEGLALIGEKIGRVMQVSSVYESEPWGFQSETPFLNTVVLVESGLTAEDMLSQILDIEKSMGRIRKGTGYASREIDIDILYFNEDVISDPHLQVPHPRLQERRFTLVPLADIAPEFIHPLLKKTSEELLKQLNDPSEVIIYEGVLTKNEI